MHRTLIALLLVLLASCSQAEPNAPTRAEKYAVLQQYSFAGEIAKLERIYPGTEEYLSHAGQRVASGVLSDEDKDIAAMLRLRDGKVRTYALVCVPIIEYFHLNGALPKTGMELFPELATDEGFSVFWAMSPTERCEKYIAAINPTTGHFYQDISGTEWAAGEIHLTDSPASEVRYIKGQPITFNYRTDRPGDPTEVYSLQVCGASPGTYVIQDNIAYWTKEDALEDSAIKTEVAESSEPHDHVH